MECNIIHYRQTVLLLAFLTLFVTTALAQIPLAPGDIPGIEIIRSDTIKGKALWGLIDGGADIYFEYGFSNVTVQEVLWNNYRFKAEIYTMQSEEAAFGIFSLSRHRCKPDSLATWCCITPYQTQIAVGRYYITVMNDSGTSDSQELGSRISRKILAKSDGKGITLPAIFRNKIFLPYIFNVKLISGQLGLQNGYPSWDDKFISIEKYKAYILLIETDSGFAVVSAIEFSKTEDLDQFLHNIDPSKKAINDSWTDENNGNHRYFRKINSTNVIYVESDFPASILKKYIHAIEFTR